MLLRPIALAALLLPSTLPAQGERITLRAVPVANQTVRVGMTQDLAFDVTTGGMGPMRVEGRISFNATQRVGAVEAGRVTSRLTIDSMKMDMTLNGNAAPGNAAAELMKGKTFTIVYDTAGKVLEVVGPPELGDAGAGAKDMIVAVSGTIPSVTLSIGDSVTVPVSVPLPLPIPGNTPGQLETTVTSRLIAITRDGGDRIATLEQTNVGQSSVPMQVPTPGGPASVAMDMRMTGKGTMQLNVDKGFVKEGNTDMNMEMSMLMQGVTMKMVGTTRIHITGLALPPG